MNIKNFKKFSVTFFFFWILFCLVLYMYFVQLVSSSPYDSKAEENIFDL